MDLRPVDATNIDEVLALEVRPSQRRFVANNARSLAEAWAHRERAWPRACYAGGELVGFIMLDLGEPEGLVLWRMLVGAEHQGRGHGRAILEAVVAHARTLPGRQRLFTSYVPGDGSPGPFYERHGFRPTGEVDEGEVVLVLDLHPSDAS